MIRKSCALLSVLAALGPCAAGVVAQAELVESWRVPAPYHPDNLAANAGLSGIDVSSGRIALGATRIPAGAPGGSTPDVGAVYVLRNRGSEAPVLEAELRPPTAAAAQFFGRELSLDGDRLAVGSIGRVEIFERDPARGWQWTTTLPRSVLSRSISLSGDRLAIGDWDATVGGVTQAGRIEVYRRRSDASWVREASLTDPRPQAFDTLGKHVDLSGDRVVAYSANFTGGFAVPSALVFARRNGSWSLEAELQPSWSGGGFRLSSIDLCGDTIVIQGSPLMAVFERQGTSWSQVQIIDKRVWGFGPTDRYQDLSGDRLLVASLSRVQDAPGALTVLFERVGGRFVKQAVLTQSDGPLLTVPAIDGDLVAMLSSQAISPCSAGPTPSCGVGATFLYSLDGLGQSYGQGCPGEFLPTLGVPGVPDLDIARWSPGSSDLGIHVCNGSPGSLALLMVGLVPGRTSLGGGCALGVDVPPILLGPLQLSGSPGGAAGSGALATSLRVPPGFTGDLTAQVMVLDSASANGAFSITRSTFVRIR